MSKGFHLTLVTIAGPDSPGQRVNVMILPAAILSAPITFWGWEKSNHRICSGTHSTLRVGSKLKIHESHDVHQPLSEGRTTMTIPVSWTKVSSRQHPGGPGYSVPFSQCIAILLRGPPGGLAKRLTV